MTWINGRMLTALGRLEEALNCLYLARESMPLDRLEDEIGMIQEMISNREEPTREERVILHDCIN